MIRCLAVAIAVFAFTVMTDSTANAQGYIGGYQFGAGLSNNCLGVRGYMPREQPPYFAMHPPVYYSHIVKRPYGVSPFPAPSGIAPIEMSVPAPAPVSIKNPYFRNDVEPVKMETKEMKDAEVKVNKSALIINPYVSNLVGK